MMFLILFLFNLFLLNESKTHLWKPNEIRNPLINKIFCNVYFGQDSIMCDPENLLSYQLKKKLSDYLLYTIPKSTPCFCDEGCGIFDYKRRLMIGIVVVTDINENDTHCSKEKDINDCFAEKVLQNWNISMCNGNNGLILVTKKLTHVYFGAAVYKRIPVTCHIRLKSMIRHSIPLIFNLRSIFKNTVQFINKPCICNDSCSFRHLKWLTNVVFFMGVIVLVTCIGGMSRRALVAKLHDRSGDRSNIFTSNFYRQRLALVRPIPLRDNEILDTSAGEQNPPHYSSIGQLPKPPPYIPSQNSDLPKEINNTTLNIDNTSYGPPDDQPPAYALVVGRYSNEFVSPTATINQDRNDSRCSNNPAYQT